MRVVQDSFALMLRSLRETIRQPGFEAQNVFIPLFFFAVTTGAIGKVSGQAFGVDNYKAFQMPVAILQGIAGAASVSSFGMVTDIEKGYFDKLLLTPAPRVALVLGRLMADGFRVTVLTAFITVIGLIFGTGLEAGPLGFVVIVSMGGLFGLALCGVRAVDRAADGKRAGVAGGVPDLLSVAVPLARLRAEKRVCGVVEVPGHDQPGDVHPRGTALSRPDGL